jgi:hypothetical protein
MKTMFVWEDVGYGLTDNYHSGGGTVVIADSLDQARKLVGCEAIKDVAPSFTAPVVSEEDKVFIFPDAGCC